MVEPRRLYVDGAWVAGEGGVRANRSLRDGRLLAQVGQASLAVNPSSPSYAGQLAWRSIIPTRSPGIVDMMVLWGKGGCMAVEDALVLAEVLRTADSVEGALEAYVRRRRPRADWVQEQSRAAAQAWVLPPAVRNAALRERGDQMFRDRYRPLLPVP